MSTWRKVLSVLLVLSFFMPVASFADKLGVLVNGNYHLDIGNMSSERVQVGSLGTYVGMLAPGKAVSFNGTDERASIVAASMGPDNFESGQETITNGGLDSDFTGWTQVSGTSEIDAVEKRTGAGCAKLTYSGGANGTIAQVATVTAGDRMALVFWSRGSGTAPGRYRVLNNNTSDVLVPVTWCDASATWKIYRVVVDVPAACTGIKIEFYTAGAEGDIAYFDDVSFRKQYALSWLMWVKRTGSPNVSRQYVWARLDATRMWHIRFVGTGESDDSNIGAIKFGWTSEGNTNTSLTNPSTTKLSQNVWYLVGATLEPGATASTYVQKIFVNGVLEGTVTTEGPIYPGSGVAMSFGATNLAGSEHWFAGEVGESQIVRGHAFTEAEMLDIFRNGIRESYSAGTVICHYDWRGSSDASMLLDISAQSNNLTGENITQAGDQTTGASPYFTRVSEVSRTGYLLSREATTSPRGGSSATIDDTAGNGDTAVVYSADKVFDLMAGKLDLTGGTLSGGLTIEHADGIKVGKASTTSGAVQIYNNFSAFPFQIYSGNNTLPGNGWITPVAKPSVDGSFLTVSTTGVMTYTAPADTPLGINGLTEKTAPVGVDKIPLYSVGDTANRYSTLTNLLATAGIADNVPFYDADATTKQFHFDAGAITGGQNRTITMPDGDVTIPAGTLMAKTQKFTQCITIKDPTINSDHQAWRAPVAITITNMHCLATGGTSLTGQFQEADGNGANGADIDSDMTCTAGSNVNDDGSLSNGSIDAGDYVFWKTTSVSGTQTELIACFDYTYN